MRIAFLVLLFCLFGCVEKESVSRGATAGIEYITPEIQECLSNHWKNHVCRKTLEQTSNVGGKWLHGIILNKTYRFSPNQMFLSLIIYGEDHEIYLQETFTNSISLELDSKVLVGSEVIFRYTNDQSIFPTEVEMTDLSIACF